MGRKNDEEDGCAYLLFLAACYWIYKNISIRKLVIILLSLLTILLALLYLKKYFQKRRIKAINLENIASGVYTLKTGSNQEQTLRIVKE